MRIVYTTITPRIAPLFKSQVESYIDELDIGIDIIAPFENGTTLKRMIFVWKEVLKHRYRSSYYHARSLPAVLCLIFALVPMRKVVFDTRGFWSIERMELKPKLAWFYNFLSHIELYLISKATLVISLTEAYSKFLVTQGVENEKIVVLPTLVNDKIFIQHQFSHDRKDDLVYVGNINAWYSVDNILKVYARYKEITTSKANLSLITKSNTQELQKLNNEEFITVESMDWKEIGSHLPKFKFAIVSYNQSFSRIACSPTKIGEYIISGCRVISSMHVGDLNKYRKLAPSWFFDIDSVESNDFVDWINLNPCKIEQEKVLDVLRLKTNISILKRKYEAIISA